MCNLLDHLSKRSNMSYLRIQNRTANAVNNLNELRYGIWSERFPKISDWALIESLRDTFHVPRSTSLFSSFGIDLLFWTIRFSRIVGRSLETPSIVHLQRSNFVHHCPTPFMILWAFQFLLKGASVPKAKNCEIWLYCLRVPLFPPWLSRDLSAALPIAVLSDFFCCPLRYYSRRHPVNRFFSSIVCAISRLFWVP